VRVAQVNTDTAGCVDIGSLLVYELDARELPQGALWEFGTYLFELLFIFLQDLNDANTVLLWILGQQRA